MCVDVEPVMKTAAVVTWEVATNISLLVMAFSLLDKRCCSSCVLQQHRVLQQHVLLLFLLLLRVLRQDEVGVAP